MTFILTLSYRCGRWELDLEFLPSHVRKVAKFFNQRTDLVQQRHRHRCMYPWKSSFWMETRVKYQFLIGFFIDLTLICNYWFRLILYRMLKFDSIRNSFYVFYTSCSLIFAQVQHFEPKSVKLCVLHYSQSMRSRNIIFPVGFLHLFWMGVVP